MCTPEQRGLTAGAYTWTMELVASIKPAITSITSITSHSAVLPDADADIRWRDWQARGAASDRQSASRMRMVFVLAVAAVIVWFVVQLT